MDNQFGKMRKFFDRPEGKVGKVFIWLAAIAAGIGLYKLLPYIIVLLTNTLHAMLLIGAIAFLIFLVTNKRIRNIVSYGFKMLMRGITGFFVELNPIAIIKIHIEKLKKNHAKMDIHIQKLSGEISQLERKINQNRADIEQSMKIASSAKKQDEKGLAWKESRKAGRRKDTTIKLTELLRKIIKINDVLKKMYEVSGLVIDDLTDDVAQKEIEYKVIKRAHAAMVSSMSILNGSPDQRAMFELALEKMEEDVSSKIGAMDRFLEMSESLITSIDIQQGIFAEDGMQMLEEYENGEFDVLLNSFSGIEPKAIKKPGAYGNYSVKRDNTTGKYF